MTGNCLNLNNLRKSSPSTPSLETPIKPLALEEIPKQLANQEVEHLGSTTAARSKTWNVPE